jgi:hypothetical protein
MLSAVRIVVLATSALITCAAHGADIKGAGSYRAKLLYGVLATAYAKSHPLTE